jgi:hypothetical protein
MGDVLNLSMESPGVYQRVSTLEVLSACIESRLRFWEWRFTHSSRCRKQVRLWQRTRAKKPSSRRSRFLAGGIAALEKDAPRPGRTRTITDGRVKQVVEMTLHRKPANATHWSTRTMAAAMGISEASVRRIWRAHGLKPHLTRTFKLSRDPEFTAKLEDIVGLYLNPPEHAIVLPSVTTRATRPVPTPR